MQLCGCACLCSVSHTHTLTSYQELYRDAARQGASTVLVTDIQQTDALVSTILATRDAGPLILSWAVCLCPISLLPGSEENNVLMDIDHVGYACQAFEGASLSYFFDIIESDLLKESDVKSIHILASKMENFL